MLSAQIQKNQNLFNANEDGENVLNPESLVEKKGFAEPLLAEAKPGERFQFFRHGYYIADEKLFTSENLVFNRIVDLKSSYKPE